MTEDGKPLGSVDFTAEVDPARVEALAASAGLAADPVPMTYPACWLFAPPVRGLVERLIGEGRLPIHVSQRYRYDRPLTAGGHYHVHVDVRETRPQNRPGLSVDMTAVDADGRAVVEARSSIVIHDPGKRAAGP